MKLTYFNGVESDEARQPLVWSATTLDMNPSKSVTAILTVIVIAIGLGAAGSQHGIDAGPLPIFAWCGIAAFAINWAVFVPSYLARTEHYFDLTGALTYLTVIVMVLVLHDDLSSRVVLLAGLIAIWALRLGSFLFIRVKATGGDGRFDKMKHNPLQFFQTWTLQGLWVFLTTAAAVAAMTSSEPVAFGPFAVAGLVIWALGFGIEVVADQQKSQFRADPANQGRFITSGLWAWSRHPNYFGEITLWTGIAIIALPVLQGWQYVTLISPVFVYVLLTRISGLPMLERRSAKRWGHEPEYQAYVANTPVLLLKPPAK